MKSLKRRIRVDAPLKLADPLPVAELELVELAEPVVEPERAGEVDALVHTLIVDVAVPEAVPSDEIDPMGLEESVAVFVFVLSVLAVRNALLVDVGDEEMVRVPVLIEELEVTPVDV